MDTHRASPDRGLDRTPAGRQGHTGARSPCPRAWKIGARVQVAAPDCPAASSPPTAGAPDAALQVAWDRSLHPPPIADCGLRIANCELEGPQSNPQSAIRNPQLLRAA